MRSFENDIYVRSALITRIFVDGVIYFILIFTYNLIWFIWILFTRPGLKYIHGEPIAIMTAVMVTRFILSLRKTHSDLQNGVKLTVGEQVPGTTIQFRQEPEWTSSSMRPCRQAERQQPETDLYELKWMNNGET